MSRNNLVKGAVKAKDWFFQVTKTALKRGTRFLTDDRPDETSFRNLFESIPFKAEVTDRALEDVSGIPLSNKQGLTTLATDEQAKSFAPKKDTVSRAVQPSQLPEVVAGEGVTVEIDSEESRRNKYIITADTVESVVPIAGKTDISYDIPPGTDIVVFYDGTSFKDVDGTSSLTDAKNRIRSWYETHRAQNVNAGSLVEMVIGGVGNAAGWNYNIVDTSNYPATSVDNSVAERFLLFPKEYINGNIQTALRITTKDGDYSTNVNLQTNPTNGNRSCLCIIFEDEASTIYHGTEEGLGVGESKGPATAGYINDFTTFTTEGYSGFDFFKAIVYPAQAAAGGANTASFHALLTKTMNKGTLETSPGLTVVQEANNWQSDAMDFMTTLNPFTASGTDELGTYGWSSTEYEFTGDGTMGTITQAQFNSHVETALLGSGDDHQRVTLTHYLEMSDGSTVYFDPYALNVKR